MRRWTPDGRPPVATAALRPGLLLDRDGTLTHERGYLADPDQLEPIAGAAEAVARARAAGWALGVITNQSAVARGIVTEEQLATLHRRIADQFPGVEAVYHCPHHPDDGCDCRKPQPGMVLAACADLGLDPARTVFVGDHLTDCHAAAAAGCTGILVRTGHGGTHDADAQEHGFLVVSDLAAAVDHLLDTTPPAAAAPPDTPETDR